MNFLTMVVKLGSDGLDLGLERSEGLDLTRAPEEEEVWPEEILDLSLNSKEEDGSEK